jgi:ribose transport system substrate-binding protein
MRLPMRPRLCYLAALCFLITACGGGQPSGERTLRIAVVPKGMTHAFWKSIEAGARRGAEERSRDGVRVEMIWKGPLREDDREQQIQVIEGFASQGVDGIVLAPLDRRALVRPVEEAKRLGVPTVIIDSDLDSTEIVSFVATDNLRGGELAAEEMARILGGKGTVLLLRYQENSASTQNREEGFIRSLAKFPGVRLIESDQYAGPTRDTGKRAAENLLNRYGRDLDGIFTVNETSTAGMLLALEDAGLAGTVTLIGFDATPAFEAALRAGTLHGLIVQNPFKMGQLGVSTMVDHLSKKRVEQRIDTGVVLVTRANLQQPDIAALIRPPV